MVGRVMIPFNSLNMLDITGDPDENLQIIRDSGHSRFPVVNGTKDSEIVGLVLAKDLYVAMLQGADEPWRDLGQYCRDPLVVPESQKVSQLFELMRARRAHMALVVDEYGELGGIVTLEDLLEEIVGEIHDETDATEQPGIIAATLDGCWEADGLVSLSDAERIIGMKVPDELDANTISGLCLQHLRRMPEEGDIIEENGFRISVMTIVDRHVGRVLIEKINALDDAEGVLYTDANNGNNI
jgi:CBS domain containing-hemolysin-like protein